MTTIVARNSLIGEARYAFPDHSSENFGILLIYLSELNFHLLLSIESFYYPKPGKSLLNNRKQPAKILLADQ